MWHLPAGSSVSDRCSLVPRLPRPGTRSFGIAPLTSRVPFLQAASVPTSPCVASLLSDPTILHENDGGAEPGFTQALETHAALLCIFLRAAFLKVRDKRLAQASCLRSLCGDPLLQWPCFFSATDQSLLLVGMRPGTQLCFLSYYVTKNCHQVKNVSSLRVLNSSSSFLP